MKYILNETPIKTTNGFQMNNISLDLDLTNKEFIPEKEGFKFLGWYDEEGNKIESLNVLENISLNARWEKIEQSVPYTNDNIIFNIIMVSISMFGIIITRKELENCNN